MGFLSIFRPLKSYKETKYKELGAYVSCFTPFGRDMYRNEVVRACVRCLANHTSKAHAVSSNERIARILNGAPNMYMTGPDFLKKIRTWYEINGTVFVYITRDDRGQVTGLYPVPYQSFDAIDSGGRLYIKFTFAGDAVRDLTLSWSDLAVLRNDYNKSDIAGDPNDAIFRKLEVIATAEQGISNAIKSTANLRGILKSTKAMLTGDANKKAKDDFIKEYLSLENEGGIASLDATQEFIPISMSPQTANASIMRDFREDIYRYFGVNDNMLMSSFDEAQMEAFYDAKIEPFLVQLSTELTRKIFSFNQIGRKDFVAYESNRINFASTKTKLDMIQLVDRGILTPNEHRAMFNLAPVEGGDVPIRRLDTRPVDEDEPDDDKGSDNGEETNI